MDDGGDFLVMDRLRLRNWAPGDAGLVKALHADPMVNRHLSADSAPWSDRKVARRLEQWAGEWRADGVTKLKLLLRADGSFLGRAGFSRLPETGEFELGYTIDRAQWGKGYATEVSAALARRFFELGKAEFFVAFAHVDNPASQNVLEKIGMRHERTGPYHDMPFHFYRMERHNLRQARPPKRRTRPAIARPG